mmetsp:Transcript_8231/g.21227  ORF Transcript_8231/g.21227 Transcript_8231/m.21227 type:complete len:159 (+) Transcript_8231:1-477(+)
MGEREGHHRHHKRHHKRRKHREIEEEEGEKEHHGERRERKSRKHRHREKEPESTEKVDFEITPIAKDDFFLKNPEFCVWLVERKGKYFGGQLLLRTRPVFSPVPNLCFFLLKSFLPTMPVSFSRISFASGTIGPSHPSSTTALEAVRACPAQDHPSRP